MFFAVLGSGFCGSSFEKNTHTSFHFDTVCTVITYGKTPASHFNVVETRAEEIEKQLSAYDADSSLSVLNSRAGEGPVEVPVELFDVVKHGIAYSQLTDGAFDITIGPVQQLWGISGDSPKVPGARELEAAIRLVDYRKVVLFDHENRILLENEGMMIDLGGIAKGYAADEAAALLRENGHDHALVNFGGNVVAIGNRPDGTPWRIGSQHPERSRGDTLCIIAVADATVVTSGKYERFFEADGVRYHHILDTNSGYPVENELTSVSIVTDSSMKADALSTAVFTLGLEAGLNLVENFDGVEAVLVTEDSTVYLTEGVRDSFTLVDTRFTVAK
jgi:thiamine biosynthesis lipoprotein